MDPMHDCTASKISIEDNILVVTYEGLDEDLQNPDGTPCYKSKNLTVRYEFGWRCDARIFKKEPIKSSI